MSKDCTIYSKPLYQDIKTYSLEEDTSVFKLKYKDSTIPDSIGSIRNNAMKTILESHQLANKDSIKDVWMPAIVSNNNYVNNKEALNGEIIGTKVLGIEEAIKFKDIKLDNWEITSGSLDLCVDWIINNNLSGYSIEYGVLFWYKLNTFHKSNSVYKIDHIVPGTKIKPNQELRYKINNQNNIIAVTDTVVKVDNDTIKLLDKNPNIFDPISGQFIFKKTTEQKYIKLSNITNIPAANITFKVEENSNYISESFRDYDIFISDGEFYSYFFGEKDKDYRTRFSNPKYLSRSYLSPNLYHIYRTIYNTLTCNRKKSWNLGSTIKLEKLKKLSYLLATSPLIDRVNINLLQNQDLLNVIYSTYIDASNDTPIDTEINNILNITLKIFEYYKNQSFFLQKQTNNNNYITNRRDLWSALQNKYGCYIKSSENASIKYIDPLKSGSHAYISLNYKSFIPKNLPVNDIIYNDLKVSLGDLFIETEMNPDNEQSSFGSRCLIGDSSLSQTSDIVKIPLSDMAIPKAPERFLTGFNKDLVLKINTKTPNGNKFFNVLDDVFTNNVDNELIDPELSDQISYSWSIIDGDHQLFLSDSRGISKTIKTTTSLGGPTLILENSGVYTLRCESTFLNNLKSIEDIKIYATDENGYYASGLSAPTAQNLYKYDLFKENDDKYVRDIPRKRAFCPNLREFVFNKNGLVWFIDSDMHICDTRLVKILKDNRLLDIKIPFKVRSKIPNQTIDPAFLNIEFKPNNTINKIYSISIENVRDENNNNSKCLSFYEPRFVRKRADVGDNIGLSKFLRSNKFPDSLQIIKHEKVGGRWKRRSDYLQIKLPDVSTKYAPDIKTYGGYSQKVIENIGIDIPYHPIIINQTIENLPRRPNGAIWNTSGTIRDSGIIASSGALLPKLNDYNVISKDVVEGKFSNTQFKCQMLDVPLTGNVTFQKGFFHPNSGWYSYDKDIIDYSGGIKSFNPDGFNSYKLTENNIENQNRNAIKKFYVEDYNSYSFQGLGFLEMRQNNANGVNIPLEYKSSISILDNLLVAKGDGINETFRFLNDGKPQLAAQDQFGINKVSYYGIKNINNYIIGNQNYVDEFNVNKPSSNIEFNSSISYTIPNIAPADNARLFHIQDIDIEINNINLVNTKNVVFVLEVSHPRLPYILGSGNTFLGGADVPSDTPTQFNIYALSENNDNIGREKRVSDHYKFIDFNNSHNNNISNPSEWDIKTKVPSGSIPILKYLQNLKEDNYNGETPKSLKLVLYNQEHLDNYGPNFSINFSDRSSKKNIFGDESKLSASGVTIFNNVIKHNHDVQPCVSPSGYSEKESIYYRNILKNNNINLDESHFSKFKNIPLKGTTFTLKAYMLGPEEKLDIFDNVLSNEIYLGFTNYKNKFLSNIVNNSICSWKLILHTQQTPKFTQDNYLGHIDYDNNIHSLVGNSGYNYIADFTDREYLLPKVNLNAPYNYIINNLCQYKNKDLSLSLTYPKPKPPVSKTKNNQIRTLSDAFAAVASMFDSTGNMALYSYVRSLRVLADAADFEKFIFNRDYVGNYLGSSNKTLIEISKDNNTWYKLEVPIYKYNNIAILKPKKYKYVKLHKDILYPLSNFNFFKVKNIKDLTDSDAIKLETKQNIINLSGLSVQLSSSENQQVNEYDLINVSQQNNSGENGIYYASSGMWNRYLDPGVEYGLRYNKLWSNNSIIINSYSNINNSKIITIPYSRAYHFFAPSGNVAIMKNPGATGLNNDLFYRNISGIALINYNGRTNTVITLDHSLPSGMENGYIGKKQEDSDNILLYQDHPTYLDKNTNISSWGLLKRNKETEYLNQNFSRNEVSANPEGSIGAGTINLQPEYVSDILGIYPNQLKDITEIFDNTENDKIKFNNIKLLPYSNNDTIDLTFDSTSVDNTLVGYAITEDETAHIYNRLSNYRLMFSSGLAITGNNIYFSSGQPVTGTKLELLEKSLQNSVYFNNKEPYFIDLKSNKFKNLITDTQISGSIIIENDWIKQNPIEPLTNNESNIINTRINQLNFRSQSPPTIVDINTISSIYDLETFYNSLQQDPSGCFDKDFYNSEQFNTNCSGQIAKQQLYSLYKEKNDLLTLLEETKNPTSGVLPYSFRNITIDPDTSGIKISNRDNNFYIINIDPEQECSIAYNSNIRILQQVEYYCNGLLPSYEYKECSSICDLQNNLQNIENGKDLNITSIRNEDLFKEGFVGEASANIYGTVYKIPKDQIEREKKKYTEIEQWSEYKTPDELKQLKEELSEEEYKIILDNQGYKIKRTMSMVCGIPNPENSDSLESVGREVLVFIIERYIVPLLGPSEQKNKVKNIINLDDQKNVKIRFRKIPRKIPIDPYYTRLIYDSFERLAKDTSIPIIAPIGGPIGNNFMSWQCVKIDNEDDSLKGKAIGEFIEPPDIFKWMNEMIFRAFFGSIDGVEHKRDNIQHKYDWEWIPYEYFK